MCVDAKAAEAREAVEVLAAAATVAEGQEVAEKGVAVLEAVATEAAGSEEGDEDRICAPQSNGEVLLAIHRLGQACCAGSLFWTQIPAARCVARHSAG